MKKKKINWSNIFLNIFLTLSAAFMVLITVVCLANSHIPDYQIPVLPNNYSWSNHNQFDNPFVKYLRSHPCMPKVQNDVSEESDLKIDANYNVTLNTNSSSSNVSVKNPIVTAELEKIRNAKIAKINEQKKLAENAKIKVHFKALINDGVTKRTVNVNSIGDSVSTETISAMTSAIKVATLNMDAIRLFDRKTDKYYNRPLWLRNFDSFKLKVK